MLESKAKTPPSILKSKAKTGIPRLLVLAMTAGIVPSLANDHNIRVDAYKPELAAEIIAVRTTKFIKSAAYGIPSWLKT